MKEFKNEVFLDFTDPVIEKKNKKKHYFQLEHILVKNIQTLSMEKL